MNEVLELCFLKLAWYIKLQYSNTWPTPKITGRQKRKILSDPFITESVLITRTGKTRETHNPSKKRYQVSYLAVSRSADTDGERKLSEVMYAGSTSPT
jgi:hypothetical protein